MKGLIHSDFMYVNIEPYKSNFFYTTIKYWKSLPCTIRSINLKQTFKEKKSLYDQLSSEQQEVSLHNLFY